VLAASDALVQHVERTPKAAELFSRGGHDATATFDIGTPDSLREVVVGLAGTNLLNDDIRNSVSYTKDEVLMPGRGVRFFANVKY
jgi:hypothetical protein